MATLTDIANILENAKNGQHVVLQCHKDSSNIKAFVIQHDEDNVQMIDADEWKKGWPQEDTPTDTHGMTVKYTDGMLLYNLIPEDTVMTIYDDGVLVTAQEDGNIVIDKTA